MSVSPALKRLRHQALATIAAPPMGLAETLDRLGFLQADPISAPARAQDLMLRHRVKDYRAGDLDRAYPELAIEEDYLINYGFVTRDVQALLHPRTPRTVWSPERAKLAEAIGAFVRERGTVHPRMVDEHFQTGSAANWFGGSSRASTQLLEQMQYRGMVRVAGRSHGTRLYAVREAAICPPEPEAALDRLIDLIVDIYAPVPERTLSELVSLLRVGTPQWAELLRPAFQRARHRLEFADCEGTRWYWTERHAPDARIARAAQALEDAVRIVAPFDPLVWDRRRFELLWGWAYRFEAYVPAAKRVRGHYAMPLVWRDAVIGWANLSVTGGQLQPDLGYVTGAPPPDKAFAAALDDELGRITWFLGLAG